MSTKVDRPHTATSKQNVSSTNGSTAPRKRRGSHSALWWVALVVGVPLLTFGVVVALPGGPEAADVQSHVVKRGPLEITVVEGGNLESADNVDVRCEVEGGVVGGSGGGGGGSGSGTQIIWLFPEGEFIHKGEKLVELEQSSLKQQETEQQIAMETARQELITAQNTFEAAKIAVDEYAQGTFQNDLETVQAEIAVAQENLRRAEEFAKHTENMYRRGFSSKTQLEADQFAVENANITLRALNTKKRALVDFTKKKMLTDLRSARDSAEAAKRAAEAKFSLEQAKLEKIDDQLKKCTIFAPKDGMVIYANDRDRRGRQEGPEIEEGAVVRYRQVIVRLPDLTQMQVKAKVHESMIERVEVGQTATIAVDALPALDLHGAVTTINNQPEANSWSSPNVQEYAVIIKIEGKVPSLKPGMTSEVTILIDRLENVLAVPVQSVVEKGNEHFCYVNTPSGIDERPVVLGSSNDVFIEIKDGLNEGDVVVLNPRSAIPSARESGAGSKDAPPESSETAPAVAAR
jgi:HlyD family secretion protein